MSTSRFSNALIATVLSSFLSLGGILHAQEQEKETETGKPGAAAKKEQAREKPETRRQSKPPAGEEVVFLGVAMEPVSPAVRAHIDLPAGTGVAVGDVMKDSPAEKAGITQFDILTKLDDQILVSGEQMQTLVRMKKPGDEVTLTLLRAAKEKTVKVKLGSRRFSASDRPPDSFPHAPRRLPGMAPPQSAQPWDQHTWREHWKEFGDDWRNRMEQWMEKHKGEDWEKDLRSFFDGQFGDPEKWEEKMKKWSEEFNVPPRLETHVRKFAHVHATIADEDGKVEITTRDGRKHVTATDPDGKVIFEGFCETDAEREKVPADVLKKIDSVKLDVRFGAPEEREKNPAKPAPKEGTSGVKEGPV